MAKSDSLTVRLDADQKTKLRERCKGLDCNQTEYILGLINSDLDDKQAIEAGHAQAGSTNEHKPAIYTGEIVQGKIRWHTKSEAPRFTENGIPIGRVLDTRKVVVMGTDGKLEGWRHYDKDNKLKYFEKANPRAGEAKYTVYVD